MLRANILLILPLVVCVLGQNGIGYYGSSNVRNQSPNTAPIYRPGRPHWLPRPPAPVTQVVSDAPAAAPATPVAPEAPIIAAAPATSPTPTAPEDPLYAPVLRPNPGLRPPPYIPGYRPPLPSRPIRPIRPTVAPQPTTSPLAFVSQPPIAAAPQPPLAAAPQPPVAAAPQPSIQAVSQPPVLPAPALPEPVPIPTENFLPASEEPTAPTEVAPGNEIVTEPAPKPELIPEPVAPNQPELPLQPKPEPISQPESNSPLPEPILQPKPIIPLPEPMPLPEPIPRRKPVPEVEPALPPIIENPIPLSPSAIRPIQPQIIPVAPTAPVVPTATVAPSPKPGALLPLLPKPEAVRTPVFGRYPKPRPTNPPMNYYPTSAATQAPPMVMTTQSYPVVTRPSGNLKLDFQCKEGNGYYPVPNECDTYIECKFDKAMKYTCPDGLHFNSAAKHYEYPCAYPSEVQCMAGAEKQNPKPTTQCPNQYGFYSINDGDCSKFIMCQEGLATIMDCPKGLAFNPQSSSCDWPANVPQCNPNVFKDFTCPDAPVDNYGRVSDIIYKYRYGQQCRLYIACQRGHPRLLSCDRGLSFDEASQSCINEDYVTDCAAPNNVSL